MAIKVLIMITKTSSSTILANENILDDLRIIIMTVASYAYDLKVNK